MRRAVVAAGLLLLAAAAPASADQLGKGTFRFAVKATRRAARLSGG